jgi:hypothetical protein
MIMTSRVGCRLTAVEKKILLQLMEQLERDTSDTLRFALRHTARAYGLLPEKKPPINRMAKHENATTRT